MFVNFLSRTEESRAAQSCRAPPTTVFSAQTPRGGCSPRSPPTLLVQSPLLAIAKHLLGENAEGQPLSQHLIFSRDAEMGGERQP